MGWFVKSEPKSHPKTGEATDTTSGYSSDAAFEEKIRICANMSICRHLTENLPVTVFHWLGT